jgi:hypothetical protein
MLTKKGNYGWQLRAVEARRNCSTPPARSNSPASMKTRFSVWSLAILAIVAGLSSGCVSSKYKKAREDTPPAVRLDVPFPEAETPVAGTLNSVVIFNGPGSWKRDAYWDEYVVSVRNRSSESVVLASADLFDYADIPRRSRFEPWALERESQSLEERYKQDRIAFAKEVGPGVLILGAGTAAGVAVAGTVATPALAAAGIGAGTVVAAATLAALPIYYGAVTYINHSNRNAIEGEFNQRRLVLPMVLLPGEVRVGSLFFPMVPNPRRLSLRWTEGSNAGESALPLDILKGIHIKQVPVVETAGSK